MDQGRDRRKKLERSVYLALWMKGSAEVPWQYVRAVMCERFGWTLDYWDSLDVEEVNEILAVWAGAEKAQPKAGKHG